MTTRLPTVIKTSRLLLRPYSMDDVEDVIAYASDAQWARYLPVPHPYSREDAEAFLTGQMLLDPELHASWAIDLAGVVTGGLDLRIDRANRSATLGYSVARPHWGKGLVLEAAREVIRVAFDTMPELNRVHALADARNTASHRVMEKLGMRREGLFRQARVVHGELVDDVHYGLLRVEWNRDGSGQLG